MSHGIPMIASSPIRNDISNLQGGSQIEMQQTNQAYSSMTWKGMVSEFSSGLASAIGNDMHHMHHHNQLNSSSVYDQMIGFASDEEDCFDQLSDGQNDDSESSVGLEDSRIQQL